MRLLAWNIRHGAGSRVPRVLETLVKHRPDIAVLTEFRNNDSGTQLREGLQSAGLFYQTGAFASASVNTVLLAAREPLEEQVFEELGSHRHRCVLAQTGGIQVFGLYFPNKQEKQPLFEFLLGLPPRYLHEPSFLLGDFNTGKHYLDEQGATFYCADDFARLETIGWIDVWRHHNGERTEYTWYSQAGNGFRLDHAFVSPLLLPRVRDVWYSHQERTSRVSDHSAMLVELA